MGAVDRIVRDGDGKVVIVQAPNLPILGWAACAVLSRVLDDGTALNTPDDIVARAQAHPAT